MWNYNDYISYIKSGKARLDPATDYLIRVQ